MLEVQSCSVTDSSKISNGEMDRIQLVASLKEGLTPSLALAHQSWETIDIPQYIMIRPHVRGHIYDLFDLEVMKEDIGLLDRYASGFVLGILDANGLPDIEAMDMVLSSTEKRITFSRAFDEVSDPIEALRILKYWGRCERVETAGGRGVLTDNITDLRRIVDNSGDMRIMIGSGVNLENLPKLLKDFPECDFRLGAAVRYDSRLSSEIDSERINRLKNIYREEV